MTWERLPYEPYDLGEFLISIDPVTKHVILSDELKGWSIVAEAVEFEDSYDESEAE